MRVGNSWNRREWARGLLGGGGGALWGASAISAAAPGGVAAAGAPGWLDAREFGARGDGKHDDTRALQRALDAAGQHRGAVFVPPGVYLCGHLRCHPNTALIGIPAWDYRGPAGTVLKLADPQAACLLDITRAHGLTLSGLALDGGGLGRQVHGIWLNNPAYLREDSFRIDTCQVVRFSGDGVNLTRAWCFSVRHSMLAYNGGDGLSLRGWDGFILDNWFSGNRRAGFAARQENASVTFTANRVEWNHEENLLIAGGDGYQINGNFFDRAGNCAVALRRRGRVPCTQITLTGNFLKRSGKFAQPGSYDSAQLFLDRARGVTCTGNSLEAGRDDGGQGRWSPSFGIVYRGLEDCVIQNNVLYQAALERLLVDLGGPGNGSLIGPNPGRLLTVS